MNDYEDIAFSVRDNVAHVTINRPSRLNALRTRTAREMRDAFQRAQSDPAVRVVLMGGAGRGFSSGFDLSSVTPDETPELEAVLDIFNPLILDLRQSPLPVVCAVQGACAGVGVGIALAADVVIAARSAYFLEPFVGIALVPDGGNSFFLTRQAGRARASGMMLLGDRIPAADARDWGLIWDVVEDDALTESADAICRRLAARDRTALAATKRLIRNGETAGLETQLDLERDAQGILGRAPAMKRRIEAFFARKT